MADQIEKAPGHDHDCLYRSGGICRCPRGDWFDQAVTRAQARAELLSELAGWATDQRVFAESYMAGDPEGREPGMPGWRHAAARAGAVMAQEVFLDVRRRALAQRDEVLARPDPSDAEEPAAGDPRRSRPTVVPDGEMPDGRPFTTVAVQEALL